MAHSSPLPGLPRALVLLSQARDLEARGHLQQAVQGYQQAIGACPAYATGYADLLALLLGREDADNAAKVLAAVPPGVYQGSARIRSLHGILLILQGDHARAVEVLSALEGHPEVDQAVLLQNLGTCFNRQEALDQALHYYTRAHAAGARSASLYLDWAGVLQKREDSAAAERLYQEALRAYPQHAGLRYEYALFLLKADRHAEGFRLYPARWQVPGAPAAPALPIPRWDGRKPVRSLLVLAEQGVGDQVVFSALLQAALAAVPRVAVAFDPRLAPMLQRSLPALETVTGDLDADALRERFDAWVHAADLGALFPTAINWSRGWLQADPERTARLRADYRERFPGQRLVGISWKSQRAAYGERKGPGIAAWEPILRQPGCRFISLQYGDIEPDLRLARERFGVEIHVDPAVDAFHDLEGVAAQANACDLVITTSNSTAHLAAATNAPTWVLLPRGAGLFWYWGARPEGSRWYPHARLFRCPRPGDWSALLDDVAHRLGELSP